MLLHLIDGTEEDVAGAYRTVRDEIIAYGAGLKEKTEIVALNKCDALDDEAISEKKAALAEATSTRDVMTISGVTGNAVQDALRRLHKVIKSEREEATQSPSVAVRPWNL